MSTCLKHSTIVGCWNKADTTKENVVIHYTYATNSSGVEIIKATRYTNSAGVPISLAAGETVSAGACEINSLPHTYGCIGTRGTEIVPNSFGFDLPNDFGTTNATDTYFHAITDNVNGISYFYPPSTTNPTTPTVCTNVSGIQSFLDSINAPITYTVNAFNELVLFFDNPTDENNWEFWLGTSDPDQYTNKLLVTQKDLISDALTYQQVQVVKFQNPNGSFVDRFFIPSGDVLQEVSLNPNQIFNFGECPDCKKEIFATHQRYYQIPGVLPSAVAYEMTNDLTTQGLDVSNSYFHLIYPTLNGTQGIAIGPLLNDYFANPQDGILWTDIAGVQAVIDFALPLMGLSVGDVIYAINTSNLPIFFLSPTAVAELVNSTYLHIYWGPTPGNSSYNEKADVTVLAANPDILLGGGPRCIGVQELKEKDACTGEETYRYVTEDGNGNLVDASSVIVGFNESKVLLECPLNPTKESISEIEVCIAGVTAIRKTIIDSEGIEAVSFYGADGAGLPTPATYSIGACSIVTQRIHQNFLITGTTPLVIPAGVISISITKTNNTGVVNISGDNGTNFPLTFNRENFADSVNEAVSTLSAYTITGTLAGTTFKVHVIR